MAVIKKFSAVKKIQEHLLGIQNLSIQEANLILDEAKNFIKLNRSASKKLDQNAASFILQGAIDYIIR